MSTQTEFEYESGEFESGEFESEFEYEGESESESEFETESEFGEHEYGEQEQGVLGETAEYELAQELLEVRDEQELEQFLGGLVRSAGRFLKSPVLRSIVKRVAPIAGGLLGSVVPGVGTAIGGALGGALGNLLEYEELESMGEQEAQFEAARRVVQLTARAGRIAAQAPRSVPPQAVARIAVNRAAGSVAPGLLRGTPGGQRPSRGPGGQRRLGQQGQQMPSQPTPGFRTRRSRRRIEQSGRRPVPDRYAGQQQAGRPTGPRRQPGSSGQWRGGGGLWADDGGDGWTSGSAPAQNGWPDDQRSAPQPQRSAEGWSSPGRAGGGRWYRRGDRIVLVGV